MTTKKLQFARAEEEFQSYFETGKEAIDEELCSLITRIADPDLHTKVAEFLQVQGSHLASTLLMLSGQCVGAHRKDLVKLALSVELLYASSLAHDDGLIYNSLRKKTLIPQPEHGINDAILIGDVLAALSISLAAGYTMETVEMLSAAGLMLSNGKYMDVKPSEQPMSEAEYLEKTKEKSGLLFKTAARCGAMMGNGSIAEVEGLTKFGENFGVAFTVRSDLLEVVSFCNSVPTDLGHLWSSFPVIHMYESSKATGNKQLVLDGLSYAHGWSAIAVHANQVRQALQNSDFVNYCHGSIRGFVTQAVANLEPLRDIVYKRHLILMAQSLCSENLTNKK